MSPRPPRVPLLPTLLLALPLAAACSSGGKARPEGPLTGGEDLRLEVLRLEAARSDGSGRLQDLARGEDPALRERAVLALGRLPLDPHGSAVTEALVSALQDSEPAVRAAAAFALGQRGDASAAPALAARLRSRAEEDETARAALVEGGSRIADGALREEVLFALSDPSPRVREAAAIAPHRWTEDPPVGPDPEEIDSILVALTRKRPVLDGRPAEVPGVDYFGADEEDARVIWSALFTLQRRTSLRARDAFHQHARARFPVESRLFAVKGLARLAGTEQGRDEAGRRVLEGALADSDWRVVCEALAGLAAHAHPDSVVAMAPLTSHRSAHVRRSCWQALGALPAAAGREVEPLLADALGDRSLAVRAAAAVAGTRLGLLGPAELSTLAESAEPLLRAAAAEAAVRLPSAQSGAGLLLDLLEDRSPLVAGAATSALAELALAEDPGDLAPASRESLRGILLELLRAPDPGVRLAAVGALEGHVRGEDLPFLREALETSRGDVGPEVRFQALRRLGELEDPEATELLVGAQADPDPYVASVARGLVRERAPGRVLSAPERLPIPEDLELPDAQERPVVEVHTRRGLLVFELFPDEAPLHVQSFLALAEQGFYEDLTFHRVVPDFVVQGGCYRGDGNGSVTWREGWSLPAEITPRRYVRGSLGMPRNENLDSGGSQIFVTHRPTPHLDGRYTIFGELRSGQDVLDALEPGDRILSVRLQER